LGIIQSLLFEVCLCEDENQKSVFWLLLEGLFKLVFYLNEPSVSDEVPWMVSLDPEESERLFISKK